MRRAVGPGSEPKSAATLRATGKMTPPPRAGSVRGNERRERNVGRCDRVAKSQRRAREAPDKQVPDARSEAGRRDGSCE